MKKMHLYTLNFQIDKGKSLVRSHKLHWDAQKIHEELLTYAEIHTKASVDSAQILTYITTANLVDGKWRRSTESFILHWQNQVRNYDYLVAHGDRMSNFIKHNMLENAVSGITDLRAVKTQTAQCRAQMGTNLTYEQYRTLVLSAAQAYDAQHITNATSCGTRRSVYNSTIYHKSTEHDICESHNIDSPILQLNDNYNNNKESNNSNMKPEINQEHQLAIYNSALTQPPPSNSISMDSTFC